ncbi:MAG: hypothetical protein ACRDTJ_20655 [Pseudonocardiaceae bacterium]
METARTLSLRLLLPLLVATGAGCGGNPDPGDIDPNAPATVEVRNLGFSDMTIYVLTGTANRVRLGLVTGHSNQSLTIPSYLVRGGQSLRFLADPVGSNRTPVSEEMSVAPGDAVTLTIPPQ